MQRPGNENWDSIALRDVMNEIVVNESWIEARERHVGKEEIEESEEISLRSSKVCP